MSNLNSGSSVEMFPTEHRAVLALIAHAAKECVHTKSGGDVFDILCAAEPSLAELYPEVALLREVNNIRRALRDLQEHAVESRPSVYRTICVSLVHMHKLLPDPLFLSIAGAIEKLQEMHQHCSAMEPYLLDLVEYIQLVLLQETKSLQRRGVSITLRLRKVPPFVA
ncbi:uncharacterized protein TM35_000071870 [Trypanosoma theileri]|uniref:Uncharacterized protein n=1 Tax=Trypanosoma theileri TaxID=67003 RepID=A0A1X0P230_9TRYP|nr:uncharacterized protein TM35_000071870 [Trypanosoma theileri]ORC90763.1 hypothetical protein TM35_000071870 [Trypanosoma theileri]